MNSGVREGDWVRYWHGSEDGDTSDGLVERADEREGGVEGEDIFPDARGLVEEG